jgi:hypothetical protein
MLMWWRDRVEVMHSLHRLVSLTPSPVNSTDSKNRTQYAKNFIESTIRNTIPINCLTRYGKFTLNIVWSNYVKPYNARET